MFVCVSFLPELNAIGNKTMTKTVNIFYHLSFVGVPKCLCLLANFALGLKHKIPNKVSGSWTRTFEDRSWPYKLCIWYH